MTYFPEYLKTYPNMNTASPLHLSVNRLDRGYHPHRHDFLEFSYVVEGSGSEIINGVRHSMVPGTFTFVLPYQIHEILTAPGSTLILYNCMFSMDMLMEPGGQDGLSGLINAANPLPAYAHFIGGEQDKMCALIEDMFREYNGDDRWRKTLLQVRLKEVLVRFDRWRRKERSGEGDVQCACKSSPSVWRIIQYIHRNYQEDLTLTELASLFAMSASRISEVIKQTTGQTFVHFLHDLRLRHACSLLVSTDMRVTEIAHEVGYGSYKTFSRMFRESKGIAPKDYRKLKLQA
ncbi:AraC family transcriptional regulator [Paenibacillus xerothermodurans]|nr:AraC family transcriptional regulator [Paenibacillus xerothermodurans]